MNEIVINEYEAGQRLDKFLKKYFKDAPSSFIYKMLRKKNIVLNGKKASGDEKVVVGDCVKFFLSLETVLKFRGEHEQATVLLDGDMPEIIYEDSHIIVLNKPSGMLSQKSEKTDQSLVEYVTQYLLSSGCLTKEMLRTFKPAVCNRLDRNTSGLVVAGKSLFGLQVFAALFKERTLQKYYLSIVSGTIQEKGHISGMIFKNEQTNQVHILAEGEDHCKASYIETEYEPIAWSKKLSLVRVHLITGKTHQIRAHLSSCGHPIIGDYKYGDRKTNDIYKSKYGVSTQMLHAFELVLPSMEGALASLSNRRFQASVPDCFQTIIKETIWEHGTQEALGVLR